MANERIIKMQFPNAEDNSAYDGLVHDIIPRDLSFVGEQNGDELFVLSFFDQSLKTEMLTYLGKRDGQFYQLPIKKYSAKDLVFMKTLLAKNKLKVDSLPEMIKCSSIVARTDLFSYYDKIFVKNSDKTKVAKKDNPNISFVEINTKNDEFIDAKVIYENGSVAYYTEFKSLQSMLAVFARQEGITIEELLNDATKVVEHRISENKESVEKSNVNVGKKGKSNNHVKGALLTITSIGTVIAMILAGKYFLNRKGSSNNKEGSIRFEETVSNDNNILPITNVLAEDTKVIENISSRLIDIVNRLNNGMSISDDDINYAMNEINQLSYSNIPGFSSLINGQSMYGNKKSINFYELFPAGSYEYRIIKEFSLMRNDLDNNAFVQNRDLTINDVTAFLNKSLGYIFNGDTYEFRNKNMSFYDLSPVARYILVDMSMNMLMANRNYSGIINNQRCNYNTLVDEFGEVFNTVTQNLVNSSTLRR